MCGIAGQARADGALVDERLVHAMCGEIEHRGPDSRGVHTEPGIALGIQRLAVIDLVTGDQPVFNEDGSIVVVLNGEIYNYRQLRNQLHRRGHRFCTEGDTEVIVHLYEEHGPECVRELDGMFAFALWDRRRRQLLIGRDRVGKKPLFYSHRDGILSFASELGALLADTSIPRDVDAQAIDAYLNFAYIPAPLSAYRAVRKLPPASTLRFRNGSLEIERYWRLDYERKLDIDRLEDAAELVRDGIRSAVRRRLIADVPLGAFLSGGVDSSVVVAAMAEASAEPVKTFSIGFDCDTHDELPHARYVAERFATDHHEFVVKPDAVELLPRIVRHYGEPFADHSAIPSFCLAEMARRHVTVALNGDGGDESFGGYERYVTQALLAPVDTLPPSVRGAAARFAERVSADGQLTSARSRFSRIAQTLPYSAADRYRLAMCRSGQRLRREGYSPDFAALIDERVTDQMLSAPWSASTATTIVDRMLDVDVSTYLPGDLLVKIDIATMAHGLEARSPLLDHHLMELAASLPARFKVRGTAKKVVLRAAARAWLPDQFLTRRKQGFEVPMASWLRTDLTELARDSLLAPDAAITEYLRADWVSERLERHLSGAEDNASLLWSLLVLENWHAQLGSARQEAALAS